MFYLVFNLITILMLLVMSFLLFRREGAANKVLSAIILTPAFNFLNNVFILSGNIENHTFIIFLSLITATFYGPLIYWYCGLFTGKKFTWLHPLHFLNLGLTILVLYYWSEFLKLSPDEKKLYLNKLNEAIYPTDIKIVNNIFTYSQLTYVFAALINVFKFKRMSRDYFSEIERIRLQYLITFIIFAAGLTIFLGILYLLAPANQVEFFYIPFIIQIVFLYATIFAYQKNTIQGSADFNTIQKELNDFENFEKGQKTIKTPGFSQQFNHEYKILKEKLEKEKIYRSKDLSLASLAEKSGIKEHILSMVIKNNFGSNFFDLINSYRLKDVLENIDKSKLKKETIENISYKSGFNSKAAFYRTFKKQLKMTPKEYIENLK